MMKQLEKLRLNDNLGGGYGQNHRFHVYVYEEYKTFGKFQKEEYPFDDFHRPPFKHGLAYKDQKEEYYGTHHRPSPPPLKYKAPIVDEDEEKEYYGTRRRPSPPPLKDRAPIAEEEKEKKYHGIHHRPSPIPLKYKAPVVEEAEEEEEEEEEEDYRVRLRKYLMEHQSDKARQQLIRRPDMKQESEEEKDYHSSKHRPSNFMAAPPMTPPKNNKLSTDEWYGRREESQREMQYADKFVAPEILTRMVFVKPSPGGGAAVKSPAFPAAVGKWRVQRGGYTEAKWVRTGL